VGAVKQRQLLKLKELQEQVLPWSEDTIKRRIKDSNFPAIKFDRDYLFDREAVLDWVHQFNIDPARRVRRKR
jgi:hypothetical protein